MQNPLDLVRHGGFMMIPLLISGLLALTFIFEKLYYFKRVYGVSQSDLQAMEDSILNRSFATTKKEMHSDHGPLQSIFKTGVQAYELSSEELEKALQRKAQAWIPMLEKRLEVLDTIITAAPLMGLLGTITGMMASFQVLSTAGVNEPNAITGGVAEALIATATGLVIALISLVFYNYFNSKVKQTLEAMEDLGNVFLDVKNKTESKA